VTAPEVGHRAGETGVTVLDIHGRPLSEHDVVVEQRAHDFSFGNIGFELIPMANGE
jgi:endo-1,4-beta-xylanase